MYHPVQTSFILWTDSSSCIGRISIPELCLQMPISLYVCFFRIFHFLSCEEGIVYMIVFRLLWEERRCSWNLQRDTTIPASLVNWIDWRECGTRPKIKINKNQKWEHLTEFYPVPSPAKKSYHKSRFQLGELSQKHILLGKSMNVHSQCCWWCK